jgi:hypothetical protein
LQRYLVHFAPVDENKFYHDYSSGTRNISGFQIGYDKLFLKFNFRSVKNNVARKGDNKTFNVALNLGSNKWMFEGLYQRHKGLYDEHSPDYDTAYAKPNPYFYQPDLTANVLTFNALYYANHKHFAIKAQQGNNFRQLRSSVSPVLFAGIFRTRIKSYDGLVNPEIDTFFKSQSTIYSLRTVGLTLGVGLAGTLVFFKKVYIGLNGLVDIEPQLREYKYLSRNNFNSFNVPFGADLRLTLGYNSEKFYSAFWIDSSVKTINGNKLKVGTNLSAAGFSIAFRIKVKNEPQWVQDIKANKHYNML